MKKSIFLIIAIVSFQLKNTSAQDAMSYNIFKNNGKSISYEKMIKDVESADIIFFGELHNNTINHWLELQVFKSLQEKNNKSLALGLEMLESDNQLIIDEYLDSTIQERHFLKEAKLWDNYKTDYHPLVAFAFEKKLPVIASNIPQRYANLVYRKGLQSLDSINEIGKNHIAPLPIEVDLTLPGYTAMMQSMGGHGTTNSKGSEANLAHAQAVKDATMAHFILKNSDKQIFHVNGAYHSQNKEGIVWYIHQKDPSKKIITIHVVEQEMLNQLLDENKEKADFIIVVPKDMTKSY